VLQIVREALSNVIRHARARHCAVALQVEGDGVAVRIQDDGTGAATTRHGHYGMTIMRERAASLGGGVLIDSPQTGGMRVLVRFRPRGPAAPASADAPGALEDA
jgi:two-component system nitrate/nitrite sensor histidine kinase NarX